MIRAKRIAFEKRIKNVELSKLTGINEPTISKILNGRLYPYPLQARKIARALDYDGNVEDLFAEVVA